MLVLAGVGVLGFGTVLGGATRQTADASLTAVAAAELAVLSFDGAYTTDEARLELDGVSLTDGVSTRDSEVSAVMGADGSLGLAVATVADGCAWLRLTPPGTGARALRLELGDGTVCHGQASLVAGVAAAS